MRQRLLTAALELFADQGFDGTTIDQIAERADVARQTVINHFPHKRDFTAAWGQERRALLDEVAAESSPDVTTEALLRRYYAALAEVNEDERALTRSVHASVGASAAFAMLRPVPDVVVTALVRGQARGEVHTEVDPHTAAEVLTAVYFDTLTRWVIPDEAPFSLTREMDRRLELVVYGLRAGS